VKNDCAFSLAEKVIIDGDKSIIGVVTAVTFRTTGTTIEVGWIHNGQANSGWFEEWRLSKWEE